jgi:hypothetical protein
VRVHRWRRDAAATRSRGRLRYLAGRRSTENSEEPNLPLKNVLLTGAGVGFYFIRENLCQTHPKRWWVFCFNLTVGWQ